MSKDGIVLRTYEALNTLADRFAEGHLNLTILIGSPGLMKTKALERACRGRALIHVTAKKSPVEFYKDLYEKRDALVLLDDVESAYKDDDGKVLLRSLTETTEEKTVVWGTRTKILDGDGNEIPKSFTTKSRVFIITNNWRTGGIYSAIESRGNKFVFTPSWAEVYSQAGTWFRDQEILDYVHANLGRMKHPDVRLLKNALDMRLLNLPGHDWREVFDHCMQMDRVDREIARLIKNEGMTQKERVAEFVKGGFGDRATFFRRLKKLRMLTDEQPIPERIIVPEKSIVLPAKPIQRPSGGSDTMGFIAG